MASLSIGDVSRQTGIAPSAIRFYESRGLISSTGRTGGRRLFSDESVNALKVIRMARHLGFTLGDIRLLLTGFSADTPPNVRWQELARRKLREVNDVLGRATAMKALLEKGLRCDCISVQDCLTYDCSPPVQLSRRVPPS